MFRAAIFILILASQILAGEPDREGIEFFENKIRPLLVDHCYKCHSTDAAKLKGGLRVDSRTSLERGGDSGNPAVVAGDPEKSLLLRAVRYLDADLQMPPKEKLAAGKIAALETWIKMGAPMPEAANAPKINAPEDHWAFQPVKAQKIPETKLKDGVRSPIDAFVLQKLVEKKLSPSAPADRRTLIRRATLDLAGLPPTPEEIDAFLADTSPDAFAKAVDRLLASPQYGERWARHWLDVVRFGESHGYEQNHLRPNAWHYRDYVIRAFNQDKPFTDFVMEQLAGDVVGKDDPAISVATGFLVAGVHDTVGNQSEEGSRQQRADDLDDIVSTAGSAFLGLTVGCAKCHDHKFDPIPQRDFYRLAAVFAGVRHDERALTQQKNEGEAAKIAEKLKTVSAQIADIDALARAAVLQASKNEVRRPAVNTQRNVEDFSVAPISAKFVRFTIASTKEGAEPCIDEIEIYSPKSDENLALASKGGKSTASSLLPGYKIHQVEHLNDGKYGNEWSWISQERGKGWAQIELPASAQIARIVWSRDNVEKPRFFDRLPKDYRVEISDDEKSWRTVASGDSREPASEAIPQEKLLAALAPELRSKRASLNSERERLRAQQAQLAPPMAYVGKFTAPDPIYLLKRGNVMQRGELVGPGAFTRIPGVSKELELASKEESARRVSLAKWICDPRNPLTARVFVNRIWQHHFGRGIVSTPSDFGANGTLPTHPELLDWLAGDFMANGWTIKRLHRAIMLSNVYQQSSQSNDAAAAVDAGNLYLWRMPLQRMEAEAIRDSILFASGKLNLSAAGGPGFQLFKYRVVNIAIYDALEEHAPATWRRTVYQQSPRAIREDLLASYDLPETAQRAPRREFTTTPLQALTSLNSSFVIQQAGFFAERVAKDAGGDPSAQITAAFRIAFGRTPGESEMSAARNVVRQHGLAALCRALINTNEFLTY